MGVSKVIFKGKTVIDISTDTVTEDSVKEGVTFHSSDGEPRTGSYAGETAEVIPEWSGTDITIMNIET